MHEFKVGYLVRLKFGARFFRRSDVSPQRYFPTAGQYYRVFRIAQTTLWVETLDKKAEAVVFFEDLLKLSPLEQLAQHADT